MYNSAAVEQRSGYQMEIRKAIWNQNDEPETPTNIPNTEIHLIF